MIEIIVGHWSYFQYFQSGPTRFPIWPNNLPKIHRNDWSLNKTIWTPKCDKLHVFDMVEKMKIKKFVHWILSWHATKFYEAKVNSCCMSKLLIKRNIVQTQLWEKPIYKVLSCFRKQHVLSVFWGKREPIKISMNLHVNTLTHVPFLTSFTDEQSILIWGREH